MDRSRRKAARVALVALAALLTCAGVAFAAVGLTNPSFEDGLNGWTAQTIRSDVYGPEVVAPDCATPAAAKRSVCVVGTDSFEAEGRTVTVSPIDGAQMARLGGPYNSDDEDQPEGERYQLKQAFQVDPANPVLKLNYNIFTFDYTGFDQLRFNVRLVDENGQQISDFVRGSFGSGTLLKTTGWQSGYIDLTGYENQQVHLLIESGGTEDDLYGFWAYVDAGEVPVAPVSAPQVTAPAGVSIQTFGDENSGQTWITIPNSVVNGPEFNGCLPLDINLPINAGSNGGVVSDVEFLLDAADGDGFDQPMTDEDGDGVWSTHIECVKTGQMMVQYTLTEEGTSQTFLIPIGGITLIDPAGVVYDRAKFDQAKAGGATDDAARAAAAIAGAKVRLQRGNSTDKNVPPTSFANVLSGDPGISPPINPETTGADGRYAWDVEEGWWRVVVTAGGFQTATSQAIYVPPEVTDLHIPMEATTQPQPPDDDGDGVPNASDACPSVAAPGTANGCPVPPVVKPGKCAGLTGKKQAACKRQLALQKQLAKCNQLKNKGKRKACAKRARGLSKCSAISKKAKRKLCVKKVKALHKCESKKGKKKASCVKKAKKIGAKKGGKRK